ncbi:YmfQ family protein [Marinisporobacter balticus]|uniref:Uncharacterized protein DUF2313 n=1 Tax=Marinisporobacter balticus TaxID=2018667 RepID=A0A4R2K7Z8_9FIRM|nr:YmfQ family protein [Marinisporobacter balticus]TCO69493.1 uncharacterized protein DUF2313 [Marinisporobacter balticus]
MSNELLNHLPKYYRTSTVMANITNAENQELQLFKDKLNNTLNQFFVDLADTSLDRWEKDLGIPINNTKPDEYRRSVIKSKLRGQGTITVELMKNVAESYINGAIEVTEDNPNYSFVVRFVDVNGIPPNLDDLKAAIEEIKPAHLQSLYRFKYLVISEMEKIRIADLDTMTLNDFENYQ